MSTNPNHVDWTLPERIIFPAGGVQSLAGGTAGTGTTAIHYGDSRNMVSALTVAATLPAIAGGASLAVGVALLTLPSGVILIHGSTMSLGIQQVDGNITADTPDGGLGTVLGSGAVATLDLAGAGAENMITGQTFDDCDGAAEALTLGTQLVIEAADSHVVYFNVADAWAASGDTGAGLVGTVAINWSLLG